MSMGPVADMQAFSSSYQNDVLSDQEQNQNQAAPALSQSMTRFVAGSFPPERSDLIPPHMDSISRGLYPN